MLKQLITLLTFLPLLCIGQNTISGTFSPAKEFKLAILYRVTPNQLQYETHTKLDSLGRYKIEIPKQTQPGSYKIVYANPQDKNNFDVLYNNEDIIANFSLNKGVDFTKSKENKLIQGYYNEIITIKEKLKDFYTTGNTNKIAFSALTTAQRSIQETYEKAAENTLAYHYIKALRTYIPEKYEDIETYNKNLKKHFFDNLDFNNTLLLNSNTLTEASFNYVYQFINPKVEINESYKENIDILMSRIDDNNAFKSTILEMLWNEISEEGNEALANYITDKYLLRRAKTENNIKLINQLTLLKNNSVGSKATNFNIDENTTLFDLNSAKKYVVVFWSSTCNHCLKELPKLNEYKESLKNNELEVIAFGLEKDRPYWEKTIKQFSTFKHVYGAGKWNNPTGDAYNVTSTPSFYLLDENKTIIAKPYDVRELKLLVKPAPTK